METRLRVVSTKGGKCHFPLHVQRARHAPATEWANSKAFRRPSLPCPPSAKPTFEVSHGSSRPSPHEQGRRLIWTGRRWRTVNTPAEPSLICILRVCDMPSRQQIHPGIPASGADTEKFLTSRRRATRSRRPAQRQNNSRPWFRRMLCRPASSSAFTTTPRAFGLCAQALTKTGRPKMTKESKQPQRLAWACFSVDSGS